MGAHCNLLIHLSLQSSHRCLFRSTVIVPHAHWEACRRGRLPLLILTTCQIRYHSHCGIIVALDGSEP